VPRESLRAPEKRELLAAGARERARERERERGGVEGGEEWLSSGPSDYIKPA